MTNKVLLFDIDHTLFNTDLYLEKVFNLLARHVDDSEKDKVLVKAWEIYGQIRKVGVFRPHHFAHMFVTQLARDRDTQQIIDVLEDSQLLTSCIYKDVYSTLEILSSIDGLALGIFSSGDTKFQLAKIATIQKFFSEKDIHIYPFKDIEIPTILKQYEKTQNFMVDDLLRVLYETKKQNPSVKTIWMNRNPQNEQNAIQDAFKADYTISHISEVLPLMS